MEKLLLAIFFGVFLVGGIASLILIQTESTGASTYLTTPKYVSCRYMDYDRFGDCVRVEKQYGVRCSPPMDAEFHNWGKGLSTQMRPCEYSGIVKF
ncbi:hypothetical protein HY486_01860 [Candidatus Woesearchaeota archaeon]|nr:hypothetical protein [Candidatus Woesearchaeota archaeon]